jgi:hypothetical protein
VVLSWLSVGDTAKFGTYWRALPLRGLMGAVGASGGV